MKKRKDECIFCKSRSCYTRIVREIAPYYDEVACPEHVEQSQDRADEVLGRKNGIYRHHISSTGKLRRGDKINDV
jgi:hypothetical protein